MSAVKGFSVRQCGDFVVTCRYPGCAWHQHHDDAYAARRDGIRHEQEWHASDDLRGES